MAGIERDAAGALLEYYALSGVDVATRGDAPAWSEVQALMRKTTAPPPEPPRVSAARLPSDPQDAAAFLEMRSNAMKARHVRAEGPQDAPLMLLGDRPDRIDAADGKPFGGKTGELLDRMLGAIGLERSACARSLLEPAHRPGEKIVDDQLKDLAALARLQIAFYRPKRLLLFGDAPARALLDAPLPRARGRLHHVEGVRTVVTFHPRWLLQRPQDKAKAWADLLLLTAEGE
ncbi:uracil-DNA glycosylase [Sphingomicrobium lutaoense]|uniref:DNA polymerase n=1 Tax=Sphingomicrobium lutaoense TaxID=515949 RepID=A0A839YXI2_9SPHN|nr:uracil-DNA glycosylase [Sphingomicrobium lutaoense]MBB3763746.1 DNA polymerase [Sphingomicrobium lutaoense]